MKIKDIARVVNGATPSTEHPEFYDGEIIWITPKDLSIQNSKYISKGEKTITNAGYKSCSTEMIPSGNILMSSRAPIGLLAINTIDCCTNQGFKSLIIDKDKCDTEYLYYYLKYHMKEIESLGSGTTFKEVSKSSMENFEIDLPDLLTQKRISSFLSKIDNKIINNVMINDNLQQLAETIYNYWFVQYDFPDENGNPYKSSGNQMVWNDMLKHDIPLNWSVYSFDSLMSFEKGKIPNELFEINTDNLYMPYLTIEVANGGKAQFCNTSGMPICDKHTIIVMDGAASGDVYVGHKGVLGSTFAMIKPKSPQLTNSLIYWILKSNESIYKRANTGSTVPHANRKFIEKMKIALPTNTTYFSNTFDIIQERINQNRTESNELILLREWLLPLLMNGQITIE